MRIYIDGSPLFRPLDGVGRYTQELLAVTLKQDKDNQYTVLGFKNDEKKARLLKAKNLNYEFLPFHRKFYGSVFKIKPVAVNKFLKHQPDAVIYPNFVSWPRIDGVKNVVIIHDLVHIAMPEVVERKNRYYLDRFIPYSLIRPNTIAVATTDFVAESMFKQFGIERKDIPTLPPGIDPKFGNVKDSKQDSVREKYHLPKDYVLFVGSLQPRKNLKGVLAAYSRLPNRLKVKHPLVLVGAKGWNNSEISQQIKQLRRSGNNIVTTGFVDDDDLAAIMSGALLFVFPSFYEGFGLPVLEAMSVNVPVITSKQGGLADTAGDAALFVDPHNPLAIEEAMRILLTHPEKRQKLVEAGQENIKRWSWSKSAKKLQRLLR